MILKKSLSLIAIAIILLQVVLMPIACAANSKEVTEQTTKQEVKEASKDKITVSEFTSVASGDSKVKSKDISLKTEKLDKSLKISSTSKINEKDSYDILVPVGDIQNFNGNSIRITHFTDDGIQDNEYIQEVTVQDGYVLIPDVEFSSIVVDGFTGSETEIIHNVNLTYLDIYVGAGDIVEIVASEVLEYSEIDENDSSTYPVDAVGIWTMWNTTNIVSGVAGTSSGAILNNGHVQLSNTGVSYAALENIDLSGSDSILFHIGNINITDYSASDRIYEYGGYANGGLSVQIASGYMYIYFGTDSGWGNSVSIALPSDEFTLDMIVNTSTDTMLWYVDGEYIGEHSIGTWYTPVNKNHVGSLSTNFAANETIDGVVICTNATVSDYIHLYTGINGTAISLDSGTTYSGYNGSLTLTDFAGGDIELLSTENTIVDTLTITRYFTQDYTLIEESETTDNVIVQINATAGANMSESQLVYDVSSLNFTYNMSISSDNSNVTGTYHNGTVTLDTGLLNFGDSFNYNLTFDKLTAFTFWTNWISKTSTKAVVEYNSTNSNVEQDFYLEDMQSSTVFDFKYSNGTVIVNSTSDSSGYLQFEDVTGLVNDTYTIQKQTGSTSFVGKVFTVIAGAFAGLLFFNRWRSK